MTEDSGSLIRSKVHLQQVRDFRGLRFEGGISPTDIDAFLDFGNEVFIFIETKHGATALPSGQRKAFERLCDACAETGKASLVLIASHNTADDIDVAQLPVVLIRHNGKWRKPHKPITVRRAVDDFLIWTRQQKLNKVTQAEVIQ
jgi:hypothetical protein